MAISARSGTANGVGGGPAGIMLGFLLARGGIDVIVLEKHADFLRDFRGDTIHPSTLGLINELGLLDRFLALPHGTITTVSNLTHGWSRALFDVGVAYKEDVDRVMQILLEMGRKEEGVLQLLAIIKDYSRTKEGTLANEKLSEVAPESVPNQPFPNRQPPPRPTTRSLRRWPPRSGRGWQLGSRSKVHL